MEGFANIKIDEEWSQRNLKLTDVALDISEEGEESKDQTLRLEGSAVVYLAPEYAGKENCIVIATPRSNITINFEDAEAAQTWGLAIREAVVTASEAFLDGADELGDPIPLSEQGGTDIEVGTVLTELEQELLEALNSLRADPSSFVADLEAILEATDEEGVFRMPRRKPVKAKEGQAGIREAIQFVSKAEAVEAAPLTAAVGLCLAAKDHVQDTAEPGITGHTGADGSNMSQRAERYGEWDVTIGEAIDYGRHSAREMVCQWLIDDGVPSRGHRTTVMNPEFTVVGLGEGAHSSFKRQMVVTFAGAFYDAVSEEQKAALKERAEAISMEDFVAPEGDGDESAEEYERAANGGFGPVDDPQEPLSALYADVLQAWNDARADPASFIPDLEGQLAIMGDDNVSRAPGKKPLRTDEGKAAIIEAIEALKVQEPIPGEFLTAAGLGRAAQVHSDDCGPLGLTGHTGSDRSSTQERIERQGEWDITVGENIDYGEHTGRETLCAWIIDDGVDTRGHRKNVFAPEYKVVGFGSGSHAKYGVQLVACMAGAFYKS